MTAAPERLYRYFDVLRGVSACAVFAVHIDHVLFVRLLGEDSPVVAVCGWVGRVAVLIFFLLSGYLITLSIRLNIARHGRFDAAEYWIARVARIHPPYVGTILLCMAIGGVIAWFDLPGHVSYGLPTDLYRARERFGFSWGEIPLGLAMVQGLIGVDGPLWTLYGEFNLYAAAVGVAVWFGPNRFRLGWTVFAVLGLLLAMRLPLFVAVWLMGAAANLFPLKRTASRLVAMLLLGMILLAVVSRPGWFGSVTSGESQAMQLVLSGLFCCVLIMHPPRWHYPRWLVASGGFSYSLYVVHWPLLLLSLSLTQNWMGSSYGRTGVVAVCAFVLIILFAAGFAGIFERQGFYRRVLRRVFAWRG